MDLVMQVFLWWRESRWTGSCGYDQDDNRSPSRREGQVKKTMETNQ